MSKFNINKLPKWYMIKYGFLSILEGLVVILTLGFVTVSLVLPFSINYHLKKSKLKNRNETNFLSDSKAKFKKP